MANKELNKFIYNGYSTIRKNANIFKRELDFLISYRLTKKLRTHTGGIYSVHYDKLMANGSGLIHKSTTEKIILKNITNINLTPPNSL